VDQEELVDEKEFVAAEDDLDELSDDDYGDEEGEEELDESSMNSEELAALDKEYGEDKDDMEDIGKDDEDSEEDPRGRTKAGGTLGKRPRKQGKKPKVEYEQEYEFEKANEKEEVKHESGSKRRNVSKASKSTASSHDF